MNVDKSKQFEVRDFNQEVNLKFQSTEIVKYIKELQQENAKLKEQLFQEQNLSDSGRTIVIPELENKIKELKEQRSKAIEYINKELNKISNHQYAIGTKRLNKVLKILESNKED